MLSRKLNANPGTIPAPCQLPHLALAEPKNQCFDLLGLTLTVLLLKIFIG